MQIGRLALDAQVEALLRRQGIRDYDLFCFDDSDLGWNAENEVIQAGVHALATCRSRSRSATRPACTSGIPTTSAVPCEPYPSTEAAIDSFAATTCCLGIRTDRDDRWRVYAPYGLADVFNLVVRPTPVLAWPEPSGDAV
ncbi:nucleotidyltransferase family protein [Lentzea nigeriaca]|uniref:nucleotidyltransferase family protein n=1 Tax=Lentzea nigeriaca TaxID=1128665 RepID=UPI00195E42E9|nr:nucleotidyltransferase family protein [Lentzea nigeriaca]MBM7862064.1 hypothetical protein [Lentzea nigeriaca]